MMEAILREGLSALSLPTEGIPALTRYAGLLAEKNQVMNLTAITDPAGVARLHFLDSAALLALADLRGKRVVDVGTGAGFPGLPLKILEPSIRLTLLDAQRKRVDFLREVCEELGLEDVECVHSRAEDFAGTHREGFDLAVSRAVAALPVLAELSLPLVKAGGKFLAMKSVDSNEELSAAGRAVNLLGGRLEKPIDYVISGTDIPRRLVIITKITETQKKIPQNVCKDQEESAIIEGVKSAFGREARSMAGQCVAVVSGKGGTGKTSFTAGAGSALAQLGQKVLCVDCDVALRNLDLALGLTDRAIMDFTDVAQERCSLDMAAVEHPDIPGLFLLTAPTRSRGRPVSEEQMAAMLNTARERFDYCFLDAPAGLDSGFQLATCAADRCVVVATADASSLRDAQHTVMELHRFPTGRLHLVVNRVRKKMLRSMHATIDDAIDRAGLPLIGVIPEDDALPLSLNKGVPLLLSGSQGAAAAYRNIAKRLQGQKVPLLRIR